MNKTSIEWTHRLETGGVAGGYTWNPIRARLNICPGIKRADGTDIQCGHRHDLAHKVCQHDACLCDRKQTGTFCTRISPGCLRCYASAINIRFGNGLEYVVTNLSNIEFFIDEKIVAEPLKRKKPATIFVGDMFDLFHEAIPDDLIAQVFTMAGAAKQHTFQFLTKRAGRMKRFMETHDTLGEFPPTHFWLGVSVESQKYADERIPLLLQTPAAVRFLSVEPMLEAVDVSRWLLCFNCMGKDRTACNENDADCIGRKVSWVIVGGESGPGAREFREKWAASIINECRASGVACFVKQMGSNAIREMQWKDREGELFSERVRYQSRKGGDASEWPEHLRVREFPSSVLFGTPELPHKGRPG